MRGLLKLESMGEYEKEQGYASYRTIIERFIGDIVLCNNIVQVDSSVLDNIDYDITETYYNGNGEEITEEEYYEDENAYSERNEPEIYQWYLCNVTEWEKDNLKEMGIILSYSNLLDCDVLCVDHYGTSWDYVLTDVKLFDSYEELEKYNNDI